MTQFTFTSPEGKTYNVTGPEGATKEQAFQMLQTQLGAKSAPAAPPSNQPSHMQIPGSVDWSKQLPKDQQKPTEEPGFLDKLGGLGDAAMTIGTGATTGLGGMLAGGLAGGIGNLTGGRYGMKEGVEKGMEQGAESLTRTPKTELGKEYVSKFGDFAKAAGLDALPGMSNELAVMGKLGAAAKPGIANEIGKTAQATKALGKDIKDTIPTKPAMAGVGAARTPEAVMRAERAADLPVPMKLTKGMQTRDHNDIQFEKETAKMKEGGPLRERQADLNEQMLQNIDAFRDMTGAKQPSLRMIGTSVDKVMVGKVKKALDNIDTAYEEAEKAGEMAEKVKVSKLGEYLNENKGSAKNAPILDIIQSELNKKSKAVTNRQSSVMGEPAIKASPFERELTLNDLQEIRKTVGKNATPGTPNYEFGKEMKGIIDEISKGKGGVKYKEAQRLYENYAKEFKDHAVISKLIRNKPGTKDRAVALEDVLDHTIFDGPLDNVRAVRRTLQTEGEEGQQAWRELQGGTLQKIKDAILSSQRDIRGNKIVSADKLNRMIGDLDADGKLDFIFGKKGAEKLRDLNEIAADIYTAPPGSVNHSNTATILLGLLDTTASMMTGLPLPLASAAGYGVKKIKSNRLAKKVQSALDDDRPSIIQPASQP